VSEFADILQSVVRRIPGAVGAIFIDWEGEAVGHFSYNMPELDLQLFGAQWGLAWNQLQLALNRMRLGKLQELVVDYGEGAVIIRQVTDEYSVVLSLRKGHLGTALRELEKSVATLRAEM
jgi:predicted regulator of Ras-like GTPase activity (Roadblock/LC7/MglB family)